MIKILLLVLMLINYSLYSMEENISIPTNLENITKEQLKLLQRYSELQKANCVLKKEKETFQKNNAAIKQENATLEEQRSKLIEEQEKLKSTKKVPNNRGRIVK